MILPISILAGPRLPDPEGSPPRKVNREDKFAAALSRSLQTPISRVEAFLADAPAERFLIAFSSDIEVALAYCPVERRTEIAARTVAMEEKWPNVYKTLEKHQLAAAVDVFHYWKWESEPHKNLGIGLLGLISVAEKAGMTYERESRYGSEHYGQLSCRDHCRDLPSLLAHYLTVYEEMGLHQRSGSV